MSRNRTGCIYNFLGEIPVHQYCESYFFLNSEVFLIVIEVQNCLFSGSGCFKTDFQQVAIMYLQMTGFFSVFRSQGSQGPTAPLHPITLLPAMFYFYLSIS